MILGNQSVFTSYLGGRGQSGVNTPFWRKPNTFLGFYQQSEPANTTRRAAFPSGYADQYTYFLPVTSGGIGGIASAIITQAANAAAGKYTYGAATAEATAVATAGLVVAAICAAIVGVTVNGSLVGNAETGGGASAGVVAIATLYALGIISSLATASVTGEWNPPYAEGYMSADVTPYTALSPESLAAAVWNALSSNYIETGTMGKALSDAGGAGNPWGSPVTGNTNPGTMGEALKNTKDTTEDNQALILSK
jgi:hypothetical protein